ncbi:hypothetical protein SAMN02745225_01798 [Ferrithrix thermotolerans DSM 19514]|uniref:Lipoprotein n=1 Tax=Ferrithrix thermotolerans DSM 19514 TaxID=1121881 RepID=A0A1M4WUS9_9ACTN|nr:hypothetical protein [Ferrithrix thermotolerans]SHE84984.1 hypothetical protein SAMN02745225_01798 [Ferrithrix thermotolerans DSM 19514]
MKKRQRTFFVVGCSVLVSACGSGTSAVSAPGGQVQSHQISKQQQNKKKMTSIEFSLTRLLASTQATYYSDARLNHVPALITGSNESQFVAARSTPVFFNGHYFALVAYPWAPDHLPIKIYQYSSKGLWETEAALSAPFGFPDGEIYLAFTKIPVARLSGLSSPAFLVQETGGGCFRGAVIAYIEGNWSLLNAPNAANQESPEIGGDPIFRHGYLFTTTVCGANPAYTGNTVTWWRVNSHTQDFVVVREETVGANNKTKSDSKS